MTKPYASDHSRMFAAPGRCAAAPRELGDEASRAARWWYFRQTFRFSHAARERSGRASNSGIGVGIGVISPCNRFAVSLIGFPDRDKRNSLLRLAGCARNDPLGSGSALPPTIS